MPRLTPADLLAQNQSATTTARGGFDEQKYREAIAKYRAEDPTIPSNQKANSIMDKIRGVGTGAAKQIGSTLLGVGELGRSAQRLVSGAVDTVAGTEGFGLSGEGVFDKGSAANTLATETFTPVGGAEKLGALGAEVATYAIPSSKAAKATQGASMLTRALGQGVAAGAVEAAQSGDIDRNTLNTALFGAATVPAGDAISAASKHLSKSLPEWLVRPLVKQSKTAKEQGKDIVPFMLEKGRIGSVDKLVGQSDDSITALSGQIDDILKNSKESIDFESAIDDVVQQINSQGGMTTPAEVKAKIGQIAFQSRGTIAKGGSLPITEANKLRSQLDDSLYKGKDYLQNVLPENREILKMVTNNLRNQVQTKAPATQSLFSELSKEITLKDALLSRQAVASGGNSIGLLDLIAGTATGIATANPLLGVGAVGARSVLESAPVKTTLAKTFVNAGVAMTALEKASPAIRGAVLEFLDSLSSEEQDTTNLNQQ